MKKVLVLTLAMVFAFASLAFAEVKVGGEVGFSVDYSVVDGENGEEKSGDYAGTTADDVYVTVTASEEGVFDGYVKVQRNDKEVIELDEYSLAIYDDLFKVEAWGNDAEGSAYATPLAFIEAPSDVDTVRFTTAVLGPEFVADFSNDGDDHNIRLFGKYDLGGITIGGATNYKDADVEGEVTRERDYAVFATADLNGVTLSGELMVNSMEDDDNKKYGVKAETTIADLDLTGKVVRDTNDQNEGNHFTQLYGKLAYDVETVPYGFSVELDNKRYEADNLKGTKIALSGDYEVVPDFVTVNAGFTRISQKGRKDGGSGNSPFTVEDVPNWQDADGDDDLWTDFFAFDKYNKVELGATIAVTDKLSVEPSYSYQKFEDVEKVNKVNDEGDSTLPVEEVVYKDLAIDATYAITDTTSVTYGLTKRINEREAEEYDGLYHSLGVKVSF